MVDESNDDNGNNKLIALRHTTLIREGTFRNLVLQIQEGVELVLVPPLDR